MMENQNQKTQSWLEKATPFIAILSLQLGYAVMDVLSKAALNKGMSNYVFVVYRHAIAFIVITPFALYFDKKVRPKMTISIFIKIAALSLLEPVIDQNLYFLGMKYTTATFAAAMSNMLPAITFILASILRFGSILVLFAVVVVVFSHSSSWVGNKFVFVFGSLDLQWLELFERFWSWLVVIVICSSPFSVAYKARNCLLLVVVAAAMSRWLVFVLLCCRPDSDVIP
ncbi:auxin-induced protein 5ng4-like [Trifolium pratense]|uniref:WAT1-related protein n=1 Tax=Trifolium pratense TaxID=57577 RepID=A0A2K3L643_TRIPR|nr:auxin-induced protein 5ng4-like [Trifolium pratense]